MSHKPATETDNSLVKQEDNITKSLNKNGDKHMEDDDLDHIDKIFKGIKSYGLYQVRITNLLFKIEHA